MTSTANIDPTTTDNSDTYIFSRNNGHYSINETGGENDRIKFDKGISLKDLSFSRQGENILIKLADGSTSLIKIFLRMVRRQMRKLIIIKLLNFLILLMVQH